MARKPQSVASVDTEDQPKPNAVKCVKMVRDIPMHEGGPTQADVHPDEVDNWIDAGWKVAE